MFQIKKLNHFNELVRCDGGEPRTRGCDGQRWRIGLLFGGARTRGCDGRERTQEYELQRKTVASRKPKLLCSDGGELRRLLAARS